MKEHILPLEEGFKRKIAKLEGKIVVVETGG
jgi:hypothetical protein